MDTKKLFWDFHKKDAVEITALAKKFVESEIFEKFPIVRENASVILSGSVARGTFDEHSDIDLSIIFQEKKDWEEYKFKILGEYKNENLQSKIAPIELHGQNITYFEKLDGELNEWKSDWLLGEIGSSLAIHDPNGGFEAFKNRYSWYPEEIYLEKLRGLFAEATFLVFERMQTALKRESFFYAESLKIRFLRYVMISYIMLGKRYPSSDKHLQKDFESLENLDAQMVEKVRAILEEKSISGSFELLKEILAELESALINARVIEKKDLVYWIGFRPKHKVETEK